MAKKNRKVGKLSLFGLIVILLGILVTTTFNLIKSNLNLGLDLKGGFEILYQVDPLEAGGKVDMSAVVNSISKRVNVLGVSEPQITVEGEDRIRVQLAGASDLDAARKMIGTTANLTFRDVNDVELSDSSILASGGASLAYQDGQPIVSLKVADATRFGEMTKSIAQKTNGENLMVIWLDYADGDSYQAEAAKAIQGQEPKYISAASVTREINGDCIIQGNFTEQEARTLANLINSGSLPVKLSELSSNVVTASYGIDALSKTATAGIIGILLVMIFMIVVYRVPGIIASIMLVFYIWAVFGTYSMMGAVFTLSGIGALVLGVGMTVDANIINYERIRQELYKGRSVASAVEEGQKLSFSAVFDAQFTTLLAGLIMYVWGSGTVKGFATMLIITVVMTLILNVAFSKWLLKLIVDSGICDHKPTWFAVKKSQIPDVQHGEEQFYTGTKKISYTKYAKYSITVSLIIISLSIILGVFNMSKGNGFFNLGIDFSSGTKLTVTSQETLKIADVRSEFEELGYSNFSYQRSGDHAVYATIKQALSTDELDTIKDAFKQKYGEEPGDNVVTPVVGADLVKNAIILTLVAWVAMMGYVTFRYEWDYAIGCIVALIHDVAIVMAIFGILRLEINIELISVLLTIIGYSINNSIVVFDRVRELMHGVKKKLAKDELKTLVDDSLDATIKMSMFSSATTLIPVFLLWVLGSDAIFTFIFAMLVGLIAGTISSIFVAPTVWIQLRSKFHKNPTKKSHKEKKERLDEYTIKGINA